MKFEGRERVRGAPAETFARLLDPGVIRRCTPGLEKLEEVSPGRFDALLEVKLPAVSGRFTGTVEHLERVEGERLALRLAGKGPPGHVDGRASFALAAVPEGTEIAWEADVQIGGTIARLGQRMLSGVAKEMAAQFFEAFGAIAREAVAAAAGAPVAPAPARARSPLRAFVQLVWRSLLRWLGLR
jgi:carbon monoxide dehydrogenase subunit G